MDWQPGLFPGPGASLSGQNQETRAGGGPASLPVTAVPRAACAKLMSVWLPHLPLGPETGSPDPLQA